MQKQYFFILFVFITLYGCTEEIPLDQFSADNHTIVIEGWITNDSGPYTIKVTRTSNTFIVNSDPSCLPTVNNAMVIVSDDEGTVDTCHQVAVPANGSYIEGKNFFYQTSRIKGNINHHYYLSVIVDGKEYKADAYMYPVPVIDSVFFVNYYDNTKNEDRYAPTISFIKPKNQINYYLASLGRKIDQLGGYEIDMTLFNDQFLEEKVTGLDVGYTLSKDWWRRSLANIGFYYESDFNLYLQSLSKESYDFIDALIRQVQSDGGLFSPTPTGLPTNIQGGAIGFFGATAISKYHYVHVYQTNSGK